MDEYLQQAYMFENYRILETDSKKNNAIVFFSGNGLYYPSTAEVFQSVILENDRYEWENIAKSPKIRKEYKLIIFVRDIQRQWYIEGINHRLDTQDKLLEFLKEKTKGYCVTTCGNSAGGYMAVLFGLKINAEKVFNFSGQFDIQNEINPGNPLIYKHKYEGKYFSLLGSIEDLPHLRGNIFYLFPNKSEFDIKQYNLVKGKGLNILRIDANSHGETVYPTCYPYLLTIKKKKLAKICLGFGEKIVRKKDVSRKVIPFFARLRNFIRNFGINLFLPA